MSKVPNKPPKIEPSHVYLQISHSPSQIPSTSLDNPPWRLKYVGQVGELEGEGIFEVVQIDGQPVKKDENVWTQKEKILLEKVKNAVGVKSVTVLPEVRQRSKREEF